MTHQKNHEKILKQIKKKFPNKIIKQTPIISSKYGRIVPDFVVYDKKNKPILVIEVKTDFEYYDQAIYHLKRYMDELNVSYGAISSFNNTVIIKTTKIDNKEYEITIANLPDDVNIFEELNITKEFDSIEEFRFLIDRISDIIEKEGLYTDIISKYIIFNLYRKLISERNGKPLVLSRKIDSEIRDIDCQIFEKLSANDLIIAENIEISKIIIGVLQAYNLSDTKSKIKKLIIKELIKNFGRSQQGVYSTSFDIAKFLVDISDIKPGDNVLDAGSGLGVIIRLAAEKKANVYGIEFNREVRDYCLFFNDLLGYNAIISNFDFYNFQEIGIVDRLPRRFDHIFLDPPMGGRIRSKSFNFHQNGSFTSEEIFLQNALELLDKNGKLTAMLPKGFLFRGGQTKLLRKKIIDRYKIKTVIEIESGLKLPNTSVSTAIIQIDGERREGDYDVNVFFIKSDDDISKRLNEIRDSLDKEDNKKISISKFVENLVPSRIIEKSDISTRLKKKYRNTPIVKLKDVAHVQSGLHISKNKFQSGGIPYIKITDITRKRDAAKDQFSVNKLDAKVVASDKDVLLSVRGTLGVVHIPKSDVVPSSQLTVLRFKSKDEALVYYDFFRGRLFKDQIKAISIGSYIPYISIDDLKDLLVPRFSPSDIEQRAEKIKFRIQKEQDILKKAKKLGQPLSDFD